MQTEQTKGNETKGGCFDFGCCNPEGFRKRDGANCNDFSGQGDTTGFFTMMKSMMGMCFAPKTKDIKTDTESQKKHRGEQAPAKQGYGCS